MATASRSRGRVRGRSPVATVRIRTVVSSPTKIANDAALIANAGPYPSRSITNAATTGPTARARLNDAELTASAVSRSRRGTSSGIIDSIAGGKNASAKPSTATDAISDAAVTVPV